MDSYVRPQGPRSNVKTEHLTGFSPPSVVDLRQAYAFARGVASMQQAVVDRRPGHRLFWIRGGSFASASLVATEGAYAVVGRHTQCAVVLPDDPFVALRHLLVRSIVLPSGGVALRVFDLQTQLAFVLSDGTRHTSIFAEGPVAVGVGEYALVALPNETNETNETNEQRLPAELPAPEVVAPPPEVAALARALSPYRQNARPLNHRLSRITLMPRPVVVGDALARPAAGGAYALTLQREGRSATITLHEEDLARGVIVGRSEKCCSELLRAVTDVNTSRVHLLLLREGPVVHAYDLASTQGTWQNGMAARRVILHDVGTLLALGQGPRAVQLWWQRRA